MTRLSDIDLILVLIYFALGGFVSWRIGASGASDTRSFLLGHRNIPWWAVTLSILGSEISALTFVGVPALAYSGNWTYLQLALGAILARIIVGRTFVSAFYRHEVTSIYEFLELRFGPRTRLAAALLFLVTRVLMSGVRLYAGALLAKQAFGLSTFSSIALLGGLGFLYTVAGGIQSLIWIEVLQVGVMFAGALATLWLVPPWPVDPVKLQVLDLRFDAHLEFTLWTALIGNTVATMAIFGTDYDMVQRMLTAKDSVRSRWAVVASGLANLPVSLLFLAVGTGLYVHYQAHPDPHLPVHAKEIYPHFIRTALPRGVAGLVVAAVLSVVLSSFQSALNALAGSFVVDVYRPKIAPQRSEEHYLRATRIAMAVLSLALIAVGLACENVHEILKYGLEIGTYTYGALLSVFAVGLFTRRGSDASCLASIPCSIAVVVALKLFTQVAFPWFVLLSSCVGIAVAVSAQGARVAFPSAGS